MTSRAALPELTCGELRSRLAALPDSLASMTLTADPSLPPRFAELECWEVTGIGASEGPARLLCSLLQDLSVHCQFVPTVEFLERRGQPSRGLIVFSQGLSPNARLALEQAPHYGASLLFSAAPLANGGATRTMRETLEALAQAGGLVWPHPPARESGGLVRLLGPACASFASLRFVLALVRLLDRPLPSWATTLPRLPAALAALLARTPEPLGADPLAFLTASLPAELARAQSWKWQEGLLVPLPPTFDVLSFAHGPAQSLHPAHGTLLFCKSGQRALDEELGQRLTLLLEPTRHRLVELSPSLPGPAGWLELDLLVSQLMLAEIETRGLDPSHWPLQGRDAPLYGLGQ